MKGRIGRGGAATVMATIVAVVTIPQAAGAKPTLLRGSGDRFSSAGEVPGEVLIGFRAHSSRAEIARVHGRVPARVTAQFPGFRIELVRLARGIGVQAAIHRYERDP